MPNPKIATSTATPREAIAHTCVFTLKAPRRTKKKASGSSPRSAVRTMEEATEVVDGVNDAASCDEAAAPFSVSMVGVIATSSESVGFGAGCPDRYGR